MTRRRQHDRYDSEAEAAVPSVVDEVRIDSAQARRLSVAFGLLAVLGVGWWVATMDVDWWAVPVRAVLIGALSGVAAYIVLFGLFVRDERQDRKRARQPQQEKRREVDGAPPMPERQVVPVRLALQAGAQTRHLDIDITPELQVFARRVLAWREDALAPLGLSFAEASAGKVGFDGFLALRDEMMARGLLRWKNPEHHLSGYVFRAGFDEALDYIARYPLPDVT